MKTGNNSKGSNAKATTGKGQKPAGASSKTGTKTAERSTGGKSQASAEKEEETTGVNSKAQTEKKSTSGNSGTSSGSADRSTSGNSRASAEKKVQTKSADSKRQTEGTSSRENSQTSADNEEQSGEAGDLGEELSKLAAKYDETDYRHWVLSIVADRVGKLEESVHGFDPDNNLINAVVEFGRTTDWKADKMTIVRQAATTVGTPALQAIAAIIAKKMQNKED